MTTFSSFILGCVLVIGIVVNGAEARPRAFFIFGDSLVDNGNNNYLATTARADAPPYGIDYAPSHRPTGRFCNGYNIPDLISQQLGSESTMPYLSPELRGNKLLVGANFASAGIGILNDTGIQFVNVIRMYRQLELFQEYQNRVVALRLKSKNEVTVLLSLSHSRDFSHLCLPPPRDFSSPLNPSIRPPPSPAIRVASSTTVQPRRRPPRANPQAATTAPSFSSKLHGRHDHHLHLLRHEHVHGCQLENAIATIPSRVQPSPSSSSRTHLQRGKLRQIQKQNPRREFHLPLFFVGTIGLIEVAGRGKQRRDSDLGLSFSVCTWRLTSPSTISTYPPTTPSPWSSCLQSLLLQVVSDQKKIVWDVCVMAPGGTDDATHFPLLPFLLISFFPRMGTPYQ
ncbi:hypothetical protein LR48_Vigan10g203200 [Vigna angularis]|uniref:GDSL esterase/lipase n=1 Tax=Phaseolus angularis TaxID=3914 RepID=A0A0L9VM62_PHAAN|nr:hypothetical protein LR48_Vigan10g203200 [Vigna angularis]